MQIVWRTPAERALRRQLAYVRRDNPYAADRLQARIEARVRALLDFPFTGRPSRGEGVRELVISGTPFIAVYRVEAERVVILRFFRASQRR